HATIRRYEGVDMARIDEVVGKVNETFIPQLRELSGFAGYYLIKADNGIVSSLSLFETPEHAEESTKLVSKWISDENFTSALPNAPKITSGKVVAPSDRVLTNECVELVAPRRAWPRSGPSRCNPRGEWDTRAMARRRRPLL